MFRWVGGGGSSRIRWYIEDMCATKVFQEGWMFWKIARLFSIQIPQQINVGRFQSLWGLEYFHQESHAKRTMWPSHIMLRLCAEIIRVKRAWIKQQVINRWLVTSSTIMHNVHLVGQMWECNWRCARLGILFESIHHIRSLAFARHLSFQSGLHHEHCTNGRWASKMCIYPSLGVYFPIKNKLQYHWFNSY